MTLINAIKKLEKANFTVVSVDNRRVIEGVKGSKIINFNYHKGKNPDIWGIRVVNIGDVDDMQHDYFAGVVCDNLSQAIEIVG